MTCVIDSSAAIRLVRNEVQGSALAAHAAGAQEVLTPDLFLAETANAAWKYHKLRLISSRECARLAAACRALPDAVVPHGNLIEAALDLACRLDASVYDMLYLALAVERTATLLTCDRKLARIAAQQGISVVEP